MTNDLLASRPGPSYRQALADQREHNRLLHELIQPARAASDDVNGVRIDVRCTSADPTLPIGGDWYLSMLVGGDLILAVGDVEAHGLNAAAAAVPLRYAMAAFAGEGYPPGAILAKLNTMLCSDDGGATLRGQDTDPSATCVVVRYQRDGTLTLARAGHPPILHGDCHGVRPLPNPDGPLLGVFSTPTYEQLTYQLQPGERLLLYTDGIIRRGQSIDDGIRELADLMAATPGSPTPLLDRLDYRASRDDACVLVAERLR